MFDYIVDEQTKTTRVLYRAYKSSSKAYKERMCNSGTVKTVKIQIRFLRHSESLFFLVYNEKQGAVTVFFVIKILGFVKKFFNPNLIKIKPQNESINF